MVVIKRTGIAITPCLDDEFRAAAAAADEVERLIRKLSGYFCVPVACAFVEVDAFRFFTDN
jgi:hypothetical protein